MTFTNMDEGRIRMVVPGENSRALTGLRSNPEQEIRKIRDSVYDLSGKLQRSISLRVDQEELEPQAIGAFVKLIDSFIRLVNTEIMIEGEKREPEEVKDIAEEDKILLEVYKEEIKNSMIATEKI